ncbi:LysR family transcriptional regulator [Rhodobacteraceae bacterium N5(2021)]|uniref:LysR family transcriptional regulator n=1 Tax=Gymnodinialimonas phycosphaerae TaxID=2841589 RepID=A0A975TRN9_9RHOB|nr:LysR substrate-binding domain-containing protein [Gymnodinialimonas phycosphaerae]MBY4893552.1 LysR family transcriptional regulator [Gymnodinialimonas phycosphaerae]
MRSRASIREYEVLRAVITAGTVTAAAYKLGVSQPAVSRMLAQLEANMGVILFERRGSRLRPTAEALRLNDNLDRLFDALAYLNGTDPGDPVSQPLRLAAPPTLTHRFLGHCVASFMKLHPGQMISLETCTSNDLVDRLVDDRLDLGFTLAEATHSAMELIPFHRSLAVCVMAPDHPLARHDVITPDLLHDQDHINLTRRFMVRTRLDQVFRKAGVRTRPVAEVGTAVSALTLARAGVGFSVLCPFPVLQPDDPTLAIRPFRPEFIYSASFAVSTIRPQSRPARAFMRHVQMAVRSDPHALTDFAPLPAEDAAAEMI